MPVDLKGHTFHILGRDTSISEMMMKAGCIAASAKSADIIIFTGGTDISPFLYGDFTVHARTQFPDKERDSFESKMFQIGKQKNKCLVGICRGAQLLNVLNGGKLWQHVDGHKSIDHLVNYTDENGNRFSVMTTSDHHQMMIPAEHSKVLGVALIHGQNKYTGLPKKELPDGIEDFDPEIVWYPSTKTLCYQPHPEWGMASDRNLFFDCLRRVMTGTH